MMRLLIVEDSEHYRMIYRAVLGSVYIVEFAETGSKAIELISQKRFDLIIVDVVLPDVTGLEICNFVKTQKSLQQTPILMVTAKDSIDDKSLGFDNGADDYLTKPFHHKELLMRVRARLRPLPSHSQQESEQHIDSHDLHVPGISIDLIKQKVADTESGKLLELTRLEYKLLIVFARRLDHVLSRHQLLELVWTDNLNVSERTVDSHISNLRKKIQSLPVELTAVPGMGYRLSIKKLAA